MKRLIILILVVVIAACDPAPEATPEQSPGATQADTSTPINPVFQTATELRSTNIALGTATEPTSSIYSDATNAAGSATAFQETATRYPLYQTATAIPTYRAGQTQTAMALTPQTPTQEAGGNTGLYRVRSGYSVRVRAIVNGQCSADSTTIRIYDSSLPEFALGDFVMLTNRAGDKYRYAPILTGEYVGHCMAVGACAVLWVEAT